MAMIRRLSCKPNRWISVVGSCLFVLLLSGCMASLVSDYDENTDRAVTELHKEFETFFVTLKTQTDQPDCHYDNHKTFYIESAVSVSSIEIRASAIDKNEKTVEQIGLLKQSMNTLQQLHELSCLSEGQIESLQSSFNSMFTAILRLELAKKRGS